MSFAVIPSPDVPAAHPLVIAHRGASGYFPEHTRSAYLRAIELGADAVEPDLVCSSDGVLVVRHENEISGTTDVASRAEFADRRVTKTVDGRAHTGWFTEDFTWAELSTLRTIERMPRTRPANSAFDGAEGILRLEDVLAMLESAGRPVGLVAEIKHDAYFAGLGLSLPELLAAALAGAGWTDDPRLTVESFELGFFDRFRELGVRGRFVYLIEAAGAPADRPEADYASDLTDAGLAALVGRVDGISIDKALLLAGSPGGVTVTDIVERAHAVPLLVFCWTLRAENRFLLPQHRSGGADADFGDWEAEFGVVLASGIDGVFADQPDLAIAVRERMRARA